ncbi:hypothetical protein YA62_004525 [Agrobacterium sp. LC34]|uniref:hypothetical protein n=2 Tax=Rhizobiaceae TaxID=82115 RepID=UPI000A91339F|nr:MULTISPECIES: hypothetical protein [Rhizobium/Agrobacterium group]MBP8937834.1 hypothetical protein [Agrobacterium sp.]TKT68032.1 hypothetical protein YA62_004525 [Agrobacterium sp. LC34]
MVNATLPTKAESMPESFISRMTRLYIELDTIGSRVGTMPDDAMDHITDAASIVRKAIIEAPVKTENDIAGKFRFAAILIEDPHGIICDEEDAAAIAVRELFKFREEEWAAMRAEARS